MKSSRIADQIAQQNIGSPPRHVGRDGDPSRLAGCFNDFGFLFMIIRIERLMEDGYDVIEMPLPAVISVVKEINEPRIASLKGRMAAKKASIPRWSAADLGCDPKKIGGSGSPTSVVKCFTPVQRGGGMRIEGASPQEKAAKLLDILKEKKVI